MFDNSWADNTCVQCGHYVENRFLFIFGKTGFYYFWEIIEAYGDFQGHLNIQKLTTTADTRFLKSDNFKVMFNDMLYLCCFIMLADL